MFYLDISNNQTRHSKIKNSATKFPSPGNPSAYFAPISPAAKTPNIEQPTDVNSPNNNLMEMLRLQRDATDCNDIEGTLSQCTFTFQ